MAIATGRLEDEPMMEMNTTPLIDVMLVLLIMFIITIPIQTHAVKVDLPQGVPPVDDRVRLDKNALAIDRAGKTFWNGAQVGRLELRALLFATAKNDPQPEVHFQPDAMARYQVVDEVLAEIKDAKITRMGFIGNELYRDF